MDAERLDTDVVVVGAGLAGLVATAELADAGRRVVLVDQEPEQGIGAQAWWSFGGLFLVGSPEQRRLGVHDSAELAWADWQGSAGFDRAEDHWPRRWAEAYVDFASGEKRSWLHAQGVRWFPLVQWAERGGGLASGHGNSVPRFHVTWGTGPGLVAPFERRVRAAVDAGLVRLCFRRRVDEIITVDGTATGVRGTVLSPSSAVRGAPTTRDPVGQFEIRAQAVVVTAGGIGGDHDLVRAGWPERLGPPPAYLLSGVPDHVDGRMLAITRTAGGRMINTDRLWAYPEGVHDHAPVWSRHGIRVLAGPSSLWLDAHGTRLPSPLFPGFDSLGALAHITRAGGTHSWFLLNQRILGRELALSGSEQNPDLTGKDLRLLAQRIRPGAVAPVEAFAERSPDFVHGRDVSELVRGMNALVGADLVDPVALERTVVERDRQVETGLAKDLQVIATAAARRFLTDRLVRVAKPHRILDPAAGPLVAIRLSVLTRKTLGGLETDLSARVLGDDGVAVPGLYAAGEVAGFGGGGMHGYRSLEGTFLGGCLYSGRVAGRAAAAAL